jgi:4-hydroxybenzoate polyprenyltransferase
VTGLVDRWARIGSTGDTRTDRLLAQVRMMRPVTRLWLDTVLPLAVLSVAAGGRPPVRTAVLVVLAANLIHGAAHILNDLQDVEVDRLSSEPIRRNRPITRGVVGARQATVEAVVLAAAGLVPVFLISPVFGGLAAVVTAVVVMHELPPVRIQSRPLVAQAYTAAGFAVFLPVVVATVPRAQWAQTAPFLAYLTLYMGWCETLVKDVRDTDNDGAGGKVTTPVRYGPARATAGAAVGYAAALGAWAWFAWTRAGGRGGAAYLAGAGWPLAAGAVLLAGWLAFVAVAARSLRRGFDKRLGITLHRGSIAVLTATNLAVLAVLW